MSVSVFHRFAMSEARGPRGRPLGKNIERARRVLNFGDNNNSSNDLLVAEELANDMRMKSAHWNFDFAKGVPMENPASRLKWTKVKDSDRVHESYALEKLPYLRSHAESGEQTKPTTRSCSRQSSIADFMAKRKRPSGPSCSKDAPSISSASQGKSEDKLTGSSSTEPSAKKQKTSST